MCIFELSIIMNREKGKRKRENKIRVANEPEANIDKEYRTLKTIVLVLA